MKENRIKIYIITCLLALSILCSCTSDEFSKEYNGYIVYSINSNKLHRPKCGEVQKIKPENYVVSTRSVVELMGDGYEPCRVCLHYYINKANIVRSLHTDTPINDLTSILNDVNISIDSYYNFFNILKNEFNFAPNDETNNNILKLLSDLYVGILKTKKNYYDSNIEYNKIIASIVYHDDNSTYSMFDWPLVAKLYINKYELWSKIEKYLKNIYDEPQKIYGEGYFDHLYDSVCEQHNLSDSNINKNDFEHMSVTLCTLANQNNVFKGIVTYSQEFNGIDDIAAQAGYIGDICGTNWKQPSMNEADYKADLDAVNLFNIYKENDEPIFDLLPKYYNSVNENVVNRAYEFNNNIGTNTLAKYRKKYCESLLKKYREKTVEYMNRINYYDNFMWHIINNDQTFTPCKYRFYTEYIGTADDALKKAIEKSYLEWEDIYNAIFS